MDNENMAPGTQRQPATLPPAGSSSTPSSQANTLLLIAALAILLGFFLPWVNTGFGGGRNSDFDGELFGMPTINGTNLISLAGKVPDAGWLLTIYLILIPLGSIIVAYNSQQKIFSEKGMMFGVAASIFLPISLFTFYLHIPREELLMGDEDGFGGNSVKLGIGFILMLIGSAYCLIYAIGRISKKMKHISAGSIFRFGGFGGVIAAVLTYLIFDNIRDSDGSIIYIYLGILIGGILLSVYLYRTNSIGNSNYHSSIVTGFVFSASYAFTIFLIISITDKMGMNRVSQFFIFLLVAQCLLGFIISSLAGATGVIAPQASEHVDNAEASAAAHNAGAVEITAQPKVAAPPFDWAAFFQKNKKLLIITTILAVCGITAWILLKPNPERDGKKAAKAECNCKTGNDKAITKAYEDFFSGFDSARFRSRSEARDKLLESLTRLETENLQCSSAAKEKHSNLGKKFLRDFKKYSRFEMAYNKGMVSCSSTVDKTILENRLEEKLRTIKEPEPDIEKIKLDMINQSIPGWTFHYLSEIKNATIVNTTRTDERIEYTIDLNLENYSNQEQSDAQVIIAYNQGDDGWTQTSMNEVFITFTNTAPVGEWKTIMPLSNCSYTIIDGGHKYWIQDGAYGNKYQGGGSDGETFSLTGTPLYIMSREEQPVKIIFRYTPNSQ